MARRWIAELVGNKILGINALERSSRLRPDLERRAHNVLSPADTYLEQDPSVAAWLGGLLPTRAGALHYATRTLLPLASWIRRYNMRWLAGDLVAGTAAGMVVVPQALAYATIAHMPPAHGLYTAFSGAVLYWVFGTSKDVIVGATAVGSLLVGQVVVRVEDTAPGRFTPEEIARTLGLFVGALLLSFGLLRLGWVVEFMPYIPISAFVTAASVTIISIQAPIALGIPEIDTGEAPYRVFISTLRSLPNMHLDAAIGLSTIFLLCAISSFCSVMEVRRPDQRRFWSFVSSLRLGFTLMLFTLISYLVNRDRETHVKFGIAGHIKGGLEWASMPPPDGDLVRLILPELPAVATVIVIEHIAISKAMGRLHNYAIDSSQEAMGLGAANMLSPFVGGYLCTGSFSTSAVLSGAGARTPVASFFTAAVVVLALYAVMVFHYIPDATLAGLIIHVICSLVTPPSALYKFWQLSPVEFLIWVVGVVLAIFFSLEACIYVGVTLSTLLLLFRTARARGSFLGFARAQRVADEGGGGVDGHGGGRSRDVLLALDGKGASNPDVKIESPYPGVLVYRLGEGYNYTNQAYHADTIFRYAKRTTRRTSKEPIERESDRLWNDADGGGHGCDTQADTQALPYLRAIVLDFAATNNTDVTSIQGLMDLRNSLDLYSWPDTVEWHFASVHNRWTRRALAAAGFGYPSSQKPEAFGHWKPVYSIAATLGGGGEADTNGEQKTGSRRRASADWGDVRKGSSVRRRQALFPRRRARRTGCCDAGCAEQGWPCGMRRKGGVCCWQYQYAALMFQACRCQRIAHRPRKLPVWIPRTRERGAAVRRDRDAVGARWALAAASEGAWCWDNEWRPCPASLRPWVAAGGAAHPSIGAKFLLLLHHDPRQATSCLQQAAWHGHACSTFPPSSRAWRRSAGAVACALLLLLLPSPAPVAPGPRY